MRKRMLPPLGLVGLTLACLGLSCSQPEDRPSRVRDNIDNRNLVVSIPPLAYLAARIGGDYFDITTMVPPGTDPHHFEPTMTQLLRLNDAALYLQVGHPRLEFETLFARRYLDDHPDLATVRLIDSVESSNRKAARPEALEADPHVWTSPKVSRELALAIRESLEEIAPGVDFEESTNSLLADIEGLRNRLGDVTRDLASRSFVAHHPAWEYFAQDYDLTQIAIQSDHSEPSAARLAEIIEKSRSANVDLVFVQPGFAEESAATVAEELSARLFSIDPMAQDWIAEMHRLAHAFEEAPR